MSGGVCNECTVASSVGHDMGIHVGRGGTGEGKGGGGLAVLIATSQKRRVHGDTYLRSGDVYSISSWTVCDPGKIEHRCLAGKSHGFSCRD